MLENLHFNYNGIDSKDMGLMNIRTDAGLFEEVFLPSRTINEERIRGRDKSYFFSTVRESISIPLTFLLPQGYTNDQLRAIGRWFNQDYYKPFYFTDHPSRIFYVMYKGDPKIFHNGCGEGYFTIELTSNSPFGYSPMITSPLLEVNDMSTGFDFEFINEGDEPIFPEVWITTKGNKNVKIHNLSNGVQFEFNDLAFSETVYIDNENQDILTDLPLTYRYGNFNGNYLRLDRGMNRLKLFGQFRIEFRYQFKIIV